MNGTVNFSTLERVNMAATKTKPLAETAIATIPSMDRFLAPVANDAKVQENAGLPYVAVFFSKTGKAPDIYRACPGIKEGDFYLAANGTFKQLNPCKFFIVEGRQLWVDMAEDGTVNGVTAIDPRNWKSPYSEHCETAILAFTDEGLVAARATFRRTQAGGGRAAVKELQCVRDPESAAAWAEQSREHGEASKLQLPFSRFTVTANTFKKVAKGSGRLCYPVSTTISPTTTGDARALVEYFSDEENRKAFEAVVAATDARINELLQKVSK